MDDTTRSCREFTALLASDAPAPGGGGAAAMAGALGAALCGMVASLTTGRKKYAAVEDEIQQLLERCNTLHERLLDMVAADAEGFLPLARVYGMAKDDPARPAALQAASQTACGAPLRMHIMELCCEAIDYISVFAAKGSRLAVSDAGCAAALLQGGLRAASLNVYINTKAMPDRAAAEGLNRRCDELLRRGTALADAVFDRVKEKLTTL